MPTGGHSKNCGLPCILIVPPYKGEQPPQEKCDCNCKPTPQTPQLPITPGACSTTGTDTDKCPAPSGNSGASASGGSPNSPGSNLVHHLWPPNIPGTAIA